MAAHNHRRKRTGVYFSTEDKLLAAAADLERAIKERVDAHIAVSDAEARVKIATSDFRDAGNAEIKARDEFEALLKKVR